MKSKNMKSNKMKIKNMKDKENSISFKVQFLTGEVKSYSFDKNK